MKRFIFILLGIVTSVLPLIVSIMYNKSLGDIIFITIVTYLVYVLVSMIWTFVYTLVKRKDLPEVENTIISTFYFWFLTLKRKKVYYSDLGYFYVSIRGDYVYVFKQGYFMSHYLFSVWYYGDIELLRLEMKKELDCIYTKELEETRQKKFKKDKLDLWDGYIDIVSKRDDKIKRLLK